MTIEEYFEPIKLNKNEKFIKESSKRIEGGFKQIDKKFDDYCFLNELSLNNNKHKYLDCCDYIEKLKNKILDKEERNTKDKFKFKGDALPLKKHLADIQLMRETIRKQNVSTWLEPIYCPRFGDNKSGVAGYRKVDDRKN